MPVAETLRPLVAAFLGDNPSIAVRCWDDSTIGRADPDATLVLRSPLALRYLMYSPGELGLGRAYVAGELEVEGDIYRALRLREELAPTDGDGAVRVGLGPAGWARALRAAMGTGAVGRPPARPPEEAHLRGRRHSKARDAAAIAHHYDVSDDFYRIVLGPSMTYSCAYFAADGTTLEDAQSAKHAVVGAKLGLRDGMRLLDVGCGWGGMVLHSAQHHDIEAVGVTLSRHQYELARKRVAEAGLTDRVEIRLQDYRDVNDGPYDAISSIGMFEHVGLARLGEYFERLHDLVRPGGRVLNHAISRPPGRSRFARASFIDRFVFPDGELHEVGTVVSAMQEHGLEVRDVESLREHYAKTLRCWVANLEARWPEAVATAGSGRARVWRLYMAASALNFEAGRTSVHQVLGVRAHADGRSDMPATRASFLTAPPAARPTDGQTPRSARRPTVRTTPSSN